MASVGTSTGEVHEPGVRSGWPRAHLPHSVHPCPPSLKSGGYRRSRGLWWTFRVAEGVPVRHDTGHRWGRDPGHEHRGTDGHQRERESPPKRQGWVIPRDIERNPRIEESSFCTPGNEVLPGQEGVTPTLPFRFHGFTGRVLTFCVSRTRSSRVQGRPCRLWVPGRAPPPEKSPS